MKVLAVNPGTVYQSGTQWACFFILETTQSKVEKHLHGYPSANAAKQAMREAVHAMRKKHLVR